VLYIHSKTKGQNPAHVVVNVNENGLASSQEKLYWMLSTLWIRKNIQDNYKLMYQLQKFTALTLLKAGTWHTYVWGSSKAPHILKLGSRLR